MINKIFLVIGIVCLSIFSIIQWNNDYMTFKDTKCLILGKLSVKGTRSGRLMLILKEVSTGRVFDLNVAAATYWSAQEGKHIWFNLREMDIKQNPKDNTIYFLGPVITGVIGFVCLIFGVVYEIYDRKRKLNDTSSR